MSEGTLDSQSKVNLGKPGTALQLKTADLKFLIFRDGVDRYGHPILLIDVVLAGSLQKVHTFRLGFKDIANLKGALQVVQDQMLEGMCDY